MRVIHSLWILSVVSCLSIGIITACSKGPSERQLFEQGKKYQEEGKFAEAAAAYEELVKKYPNSKQAPQCLFMVGYLYANHLADYARARRVYETFLKKYPDDPLVKDARWELSHLGKDLNEIPELNELLQSSSDSAAKGAKPNTSSK
ncbi:MAG: tetratricopeptide repeat protein [Calditrichaeota bacterium]|nr:tetratricopeptide repeat protein [Calditrichota bacterium]